MENAPLNPNLLVAAQNQPDNQQQGRQVNDQNRQRQPRNNNRQTGQDKLYDNPDYLQAKVSYEVSNAANIKHTLVNVPQNVDPLSTHKQEFLAARRHYMLPPHKNVYDVIANAYADLKAKELANLNAQNAITKGRNDIVSSNLADFKHVQHKDLLAVTHAHHKQATNIKVDLAVPINTPANYIDKYIEAGMNVIYNLQLKSINHSLVRTLMVYLIKQTRAKLQPNTIELYASLPYSWLTDKTLTIFGDYTAKDKTRLRKYFNNPFYYINGVKTDKIRDVVISPTNLPANIIRATHDEAGDLAYPERYEFKPRYHIIIDAWYYPNARKDFLHSMIRHGPGTAGYILLSVVDSPTDGHFGSYLAQNATKSAGSIKFNGQLAKWDNHITSDHYPHHTIRYDGGAQFRHCMFERVVKEVTIIVDRNDTRHKFTICDEKTISIDSNFHIQSLFISYDGPAADAQPAPNDLQDLLEFNEKISKELGLREFKKAYVSIAKPGMSPRVIINTANLVLHNNKIRGITSQDAIKAASEMVEEMNQQQDQLSWIHDDSTTRRFSALLFRSLANGYGFALLLITMFSVAELFSHIPVTLKMIRFTTVFGLIFFKDFGHFTANTDYSRNRILILSFLALTMILDLIYHKHLYSPTAVIISDTEQDQELLSSYSLN